MHRIERANRDELDDDEEMDDFLDDSEDTVLGRAAFSAGKGMEPESTGLCWENRTRLGPNPHMYKFHMEFVHGELASILLEQA